MLNLTHVLLISVGYLTIIFIIAWLADKHSQTAKPRPWVYTLALGVHCSSWSFFGTTLQSYNYGWAFTPTYLGSVVLFAFGVPLLWKVILLCRQHNITSLADFLSIRYNKSATLAAMVTLLAFIGVVPYIALQLDAITTSINFVSEDSLSGFNGSVGLVVTISLAVFAILFGTRKVNLTEKNTGLMVAIAFESIVKLLAFLIVGAFIVYGMFDGFFDLISQASRVESAHNVTQRDGAWLLYIGHIVLGLCSVFCLPRLFHINFVENRGEQELKTARWGFPLYLFAINFFVLPVALAGSVIFADQDIGADTFILALPMYAQNPVITLTGLLGGVASATSMVIVATLTVGIMVSNNLLTPLLIRKKQSIETQHRLEPKVLLLIRRLTIILVIAAAYLYYQGISRSAPLVNSGVIAMSLLAQLMPAFVFGMFWPRANKTAAMLAILSGVIGCLLLQLWPSIKGSYYFDPPPGDMQLIQGFMTSLLINTLVFILVAGISGRPLTSGYERFTRAASRFAPLSVSTVRQLAAKFYSPLEQDQLHRQLAGMNDDQIAPASVLADVERSLTAVLGNTGSQLLLANAAEHASPVKGLVDMVEEVGQRYQFNLELLQSSIGHIDQGIAVVDRDLNLVAWNQRYVDLFDYPAALIKAGVNVRELLAFNARRGLFGKDADIEQEIQKRIAYLQQGSRYKYQRAYDNGLVIEINGNPMPGGGFVTTYTDISEYVATQQQLHQAKTELEHRVEQRTHELKKTNLALQEAKREAERANDSKTRFLAAAGHDLMQPFNAATLFTAMLEQKTQNSPLAEQVAGVRQSLSSAESLLRMLLDISRLETGGLQAQLSAFSLDELLAPLIQEFSVIAEQKSLKLRYVASRVWVKSDKQLLRRILQNLISNGIRYTQQGTVLVGCRRVKNQICIQVIDTGIGIPDDQQQVIFNEFHQLSSHASQQGLGLGLTIVERISKLLDHPLQVRSKLGHGSCFGVHVPRTTPLQTVHALPIRTDGPSPNLLKGKSIILIDDDPQILKAMAGLLGDWGAQVHCVKDRDALSLAAKQGADLVLADFQLQQGETGIEWTQWLFSQWQHQVPVIINSANQDDNVREQTLLAGFAFLPKPVKPAALKRALKKQLTGV